jgi:tetratricopeptide (TPR) repeat protein
MANRSKKFIFVPFCLMAQAYQAKGIVKYEWKSSIKPIMQLLIDNDINKISEYLSNIDFNVLNVNDQKFYNYLIAKIYISNGKLDKAKEYLLLAINNSKNFKKDNIVELLSYHELLKHGLITTKNQLLEKILMDSILDIASSDQRYFYLLNESIETCLDKKKVVYANKLLEKQLVYINANGLYKYLPFYYQNKIKLNPNNKNLQRELHAKLKAITTINKNNSSMS